MLAGGFPLALARASADARRRWFRDFRGLRVLRDRLGAVFVGGVVLHLGPLAYTAEDRLHALPLQTLWQS